jgi:hypothetical protein
MTLASAFYDSALLFGASDAGLFATLAQLGQADAAAVAAAAGLDTRAATLMLDGCVALGLVEKHGSEYRNAADAAVFLVPGSPADLSSAIRYARDVYPAWRDVNTFARTGRPVERPELHLGENADRTRTFVLSMHSKAKGTARGILPFLDLHGCKQLLDVGGGPGTFSVLLSQQYPALQCTVLDLPAVTSIADELIEQQGAGGRVSSLAGSYHSTPFPSGNDAVLFFGMMHQESAEANRALLAKAFESMNSGAVVYVMDMMTDSTHTAPKFSALFALNMALTAQSGWVFSDQELEEWIRAAGFVDYHVQPLPHPIPHWLARARKP